MVKTRIQNHQLTHSIKKGDTLQGVCNISVPNLNGTYGIISNGSYYEKKTSGGSFTSFTYDGGIIRMFWNGIATENITLALVGTGQTHKIFGDGSNQTHYVSGSMTPEIQPSYLETLDKLDQWTSAHYVPHSNNALDY